MRLESKAQQRQSRVKHHLSLNALAAQKQLQKIADNHTRITELNASQAINYANLSASLEELMNMTIKNIEKEMSDNEN